MSSTGQTNNCNIFTVFPLGVSCSTTDANSNGYGGTMVLFITGGTPPYSINWSTGDVGVTTVTNLASGTYTATVIDNYGDYTATTTCVVNAITPSPTTSPTPTPTPSPLPTYPSELCLTKNQAPNTQYAFGYKGIVNGKPSWTGSTYDVVYNNTNTPPRWEISGYSPNNIILQSNANIPQGLWTELGSSNTWLMTTGTCVTAALNASVSKTMESCLNQSDGTITVTAWAGVPPYSYSLDALTYQSSPTFTGLPSGLGTVYVKDSTGLVIIRGYSILAGPAPTTYNLVLSSRINTIASSSSNNTKSVGWSLSVSPALPVGVSMTADILITNNFTNNYNFQQQILLNRNYSVTANGNAVINTNGNEVITSQTTPRRCAGSGTIFSGISKTYSVTLSGGSITGLNTFGVQNSNPSVINDCPAFGNNIHSIQIINPVLSTSNCGNVLVSNSVSESVNV